jgi:hypothetical protein
VKAAQQVVGGRLCRRHELGVSKVALVDVPDCVGLRSAPCQRTHEQALTEHGARSIDVPGLVEQRAHSTPTGPVEQQVVALSDYEPRRGSDGDCVRYRLLDRPVEIGPEERRAGIASQALEEADEALDVERLWRALDFPEPELLEPVVRQVETVQRGDGGEARPSLRVRRTLDRCGEGGLAGPWWA